VNRLHTYAFTAAMEIAMLAWVAFGLRLKRTSLRSLLGAFSFRFRSIALDLCIAAVFWFGSLMVLGALGITWSGVEAALTHRLPATHTAPGQTGGLFVHDPSRLKALRVLAELAPENPQEIAAWALLSLLAGFIEEIIFRGYLQQQFIAWARGSVGWGVAASAVVFGAAHAYQGVRGIVLITAFGGLFSVLALFRRSLRPGIFAHGWHDLIAGLALALLRSNHII
jgi:membrane protease YdiL (CAAX protease family)